MALIRRSRSPGDIDPLSFLREISGWCYRRIPDTVWKSVMEERLLESLNRSIIAIDDVHLHRRRNKPHPMLNELVGEVYDE